MPVQFAGKRQADLLFVLALWHELMSAWHPELAEPMAAPMRRRHARESLATLLRADAHTEAPRDIAERACGFDVVLRLASGQIDTMHATTAFFEHPDNRQWFIRVDMPGTTVAGVQLTALALATWTGATETERGRALDEARRLLESDIESRGVIVRLLPRQDLVASLRTSVKPASDRTGYLHALVQDIHTDPFQPVYRKRTFGQPVTGWDARLAAYFWPAPSQGYHETHVAIQGLIEASSQLARALSERGNWNAAEQAQAVALAHAIFTWGGVPQDPKTVTPSTVEAVYAAALRDDRAAQANMNSGWTKVAAFATAHLEDADVGRPQVIWDSRVATAIVNRLERVVPDHIEIADLFPGIGAVPGRGGTRPRAFMRKWPSGYANWPAQVAGSQIVRDIRDILNQESARLALVKKRWTTRDVEMVLFMDGY